MYMPARRLLPQLRHQLLHYPAVVLLGPRQVGKTTLALDLGEERPSLYLDLEEESDRAKLASPALYLAQHENQLVILDEVHRLPELFQPLRGIIDKGVRKAKKAANNNGNGRFLLLGSASLDLLQQSSESLAGRVAYLELGPFNALEIEPNEIEQLWVRGGFPNSFLAPTEALSLDWRRNFIKSYLERDVLQFAPRIAAETLRRLWIMLAHNQAQLLNAANLARSLAVDGKTVASYLDLLVDLLLVRRLPAWHRNEGKRMIKAPKVYVRDSGVAHALLGIPDKEALLSHPVNGQTWESFVIETLIMTAPEGTQANYYRSSNGAEIDLVLTLPSDEIWAIEVKRSHAPKTERGFFEACAHIKPAQRFVVYPGTDTYPLNQDTTVLSLPALAQRLQPKTLTA
jgi:uncharacterized protein